MDRQARADGCGHGLVDQADPAAARTLSMLLLVVSIGVLVGLRRRWLVTS